MTLETNLITFNNPVFYTYALTATIMILKLMLQPWMTVYRIMASKSGLRSPEDLRKTPLNPNPEPSQLEVNDYVDRTRRMNMNDLETIPGFLAAGFLFVLSEPALLLAQILLWGFVAARALHFVAYATAQIHDIRATFWTLSSVSVLVMAVYTLVQLV